MDPGECGHILHPDQYQRYKIGAALLRNKDDLLPPFVCKSLAETKNRASPPNYFPVFFTLFSRLHGYPMRGHLDVVRWLVRTAGAEADRPNNDGCTPLLFACEQGHMGVAQWLVREGGAKVTVSCYYLVFMFGGRAFVDCMYEYKGVLPLCFFSHFCRQGNPDRAKKWMVHLCSALGIHQFVLY